MTGIDLDAFLGDHLAGPDLVGLDVAPRQHTEQVVTGIVLDAFLGDVAAGWSPAPGAPSFRGRSGSR